MVKLSSLEVYNIKQIYSITRKNMNIPSDSLDVLEKIIEEFEEVVKKSKRNKKKVVNLDESLIYNGISSAVGENSLNFSESEKERYEDLLSREEILVNRDDPDRTRHYGHRLTMEESYERLVPKHQKMQEALLSLKNLRDYL